VFIDFQERHKTWRRRNPVSSPFRVIWNGLPDGDKWRLSVGIVVVAGEVGFSESFEYKFDNTIENNFAYKLGAEAGLNLGPGLEIYSNGPISSLHSTTEGCLVLCATLNSDGSNYQWILSVSPKIGASTGIEQTAPIYQ
jgi:hypothetical protein